MEVWFYPRIGPRGQHHALTKKRLHLRSSRARQEGFLPLDTDLFIEVSRSERFGLVRTSEVSAFNQGLLPTCVEWAVDKLN